MPDALKKKLGPLPLWQWVLIGAVVGVGAILWRRGHPAAAQDAAAAAIPSDAQYNPIDPTTGLPVSGGVSTGPTSADPGLIVTDPGAAAPPSFTDLLTGFGQLEDLLAGIQGLQPGPAIETDQGVVQAQTGTRSAVKKPGVFTQTTGPRAGRNYIVQGGQRLYESKPGKGDWGKAKGSRATIKKATPAKKSPGHTVTKHGGRKRTPSSSAAHNPRQHHNVRAPAHERHNPTKHPSAQHPKAKQPVHAGATPAAHPPAKKPAKKKKH